MFKVTSQQSGDENQKQVSGPPGLFLQGGRAAPSHPTSTSSFCYCVNSKHPGPILRVSSILPIFKSEDYTWHFLPYAFIFNIFLEWNWGGITIWRERIKLLTKICFRNMDSSVSFKKNAYDFISLFPLHTNYLPINLGLPGSSRA